MDFLSQAYEILADIQENSPCSTWRPWYVPKKMQTIWICTYTERLSTHSSRVINFWAGCTWWNAVCLFKPEWTWSCRMQESDNPVDTHFTQPCGSNIAATSQSFLDSSQVFHFSCQQLRSTLWKHKQPMLTYHSSFCHYMLSLVTVFEKLWCSFRATCIGYVATPYPINDCKLDLLMYMSSETLQNYQVILSFQLERQRLSLQSGRSSTQGLVVCGLTPPGHMLKCPWTRHWSPMMSKKNPATEVALGTLGASPKPGEKLGRVASGRASSVKICAK